MRKILISGEMDYSRFLIRRFRFWNLYLHDAQYPYLGRCYAAAIRKDADLVTDMAAEEAEELFSAIVPAWHRAVCGLFGESRPNVAILGNTWPHLHAHLIPRFRNARTFAGTEFVDPNPDGNYSPYPKKAISEDALMEIREAIAGAMQRQSG